ncbi:MAG TPA: vitamin B12-dependent ribonucleotide reductase [Myxococcales bacterium]|nr:vitamin B12-dependent ribonucleotide reductase [Myxococcales bacterium]HIK85647.1 vitamin B12-dependent ribonucleotide reductase [Myxococcales bacterium]
MQITRERLPGGKAVSDGRDRANGVKGSEESEQAAAATGLTINRHFTKPGVDPFDEIEWELRSALIANEKGEAVFEQNDVEIPSDWSQLATNVVVSKYFRGHVGTPERETSVRQLIGRVVGRIRSWGEEGGYFATEEDAQAYADELTYLLVHQKMAFNSPVWFNLGVEGTRQQASACFINSVEDTMESIMDLAKTEALLFKGGSGAGSNLSTIRSSRELLAGGGVASGPVSFMRGFDSFAGVIKSGGKTRRAAKMVILNVDHPDVMDFIGCKAAEEKKAWSLIEENYDGGFNVPGGAYDSVFFQNANHSVRVTDEFMASAGRGGAWETKAVTTGDVVETLRADEILREMAEAAHLCGDPGIQYDSTINTWNPVKNSGRINSSNPCSEYMFLDDTACNLASLNLMTFVDDAGSFEVEDYRRAAGLTILGQEILVDYADYPTPQIERNSHLYRPLGLGFANLGALLMADGLPYDSEQGRNVAASLTSLMCGEAYRMSAEIAQAMGPFSEYKANRKPFLEVIEMHRDAAYAAPPAGVQKNLMRAARHSWDEALELGTAHGYKNGQVTVLAPTGTIAFMMDCDTTGVEPDIALVKYKKLVGGGFLKIVNNTVPMALAKLGYSQEEVDAIVAFIDDKETIEGAPGLSQGHLSVFDCAFRAQNGVRSIDWMGHIRMMGAVQPFLSGAISKTVNLPSDATVENVMEAYTAGWKLGLKALAVYRDGSKRTQPLNAGRDLADSAASEADNLVELDQYRPRRHKLNDDREAFTHKFSIAGHEGYLTTGLYENGQPGEIFLRMAKEGSTVSGLMDTIATMTSISLQYGVPLKALVDKFSHTRFEPSGFTNNKQIPIAKSVMDYVFRYLGNRYLEVEATDAGEGSEESASTAAAPVSIRPEGGTTELTTISTVSSSAASTPLQAAGAVAGGSGGATTNAVSTPSGTNVVGSFVNQADAPSCMDCGSIMIRNGACYKCPNCGSTSGCS